MTEKGSYNNNNNNKRKSWGGWKNNDKKGLKLSELPNYPVLTEEVPPLQYESYNRNDGLSKAKKESEKIPKENRKKQFFFFNHCETIYAPYHFQEEYVSKIPGKEPTIRLEDNLLLGMSTLVDGRIKGRDREDIESSKKKNLEYHRDLIFFRGRTLDDGRPVYALVDYDVSSYGPTMFLEAREGFDVSSYMEDEKTVVSLPSRNHEVNGLSEETPGHVKFVRWFQNYMFGKISEANPFGNYIKTKLYAKKNSNKSLSASSDGGEDDCERSSCFPLVEPWTIKSFLLHKNRKGIKTIYGYIPEPEDGGPDRYVLQLNLTTKTVARNIHTFFESEEYLNFAAKGIVPTIRTFESSVAFDSQWRQEFDVQFSNCYQTNNYEYAKDSEINSTFSVVRGINNHGDDNPFKNDEENYNCANPLYIILKSQASISPLVENDFLKKIKNDIEYLSSKDEHRCEILRQKYRDVLEGTTKIPRKNKECTAAPFTVCKPLVCSFDIETNTTFDRVSGQLRFSVAKWNPQTYADRYKFLLSKASAKKLNNMYPGNSEEAHLKLAKMLSVDSKDFLKKRFQDDLKGIDLSDEVLVSKIIEEKLLNGVLPDSNETDAVTVICFVFRRNETGVELKSKLGAYCFTWHPDLKKKGFEHPNFDNITRLSGYFSNAKCKIFKSELEMIEAFVKVAGKYHSDIILGHNIMEFDMKYLIDRMELLRSQELEYPSKNLVEATPSSFSFGCFKGKNDGHRHYTFYRGGREKTTYVVKTSGITILDTIHSVRNENFGIKDFKLPYTLSCLMFSNLRYPGKEDILRKLEVEISKSRDMWFKGGAGLAYFVGYCLFDAVGCVMLTEMKNYNETAFIVADITSTQPPQVFMKGSQNIVMSYVYKMAWMYGKKYMIPDYGIRELHWPDLWHDHVYRRRMKEEASGLKRSVARDSNEIEIYNFEDFEDVRKIYETSPILKRQWESGRIRKIPDYRKLPDEEIKKLNPFFPLPKRTRTEQDPEDAMEMDQEDTKSKKKSALPKTRKSDQKIDKNQQSMDKYVTKKRKEDEIFVQSHVPDVPSHSSPSSKSATKPKSKKKELVVVSPEERYVYNEEEKKRKQKEKIIAKTKGYMGGNVLATFRGFFFENLEEVLDFVSMYPSIICDYNLDFCNMVTENMRKAFRIPFHKLTLTILGPAHLTQMGNVFKSKRHADRLGYTCEDLAYIYYFQQKRQDELILINIIKVLLAHRALAKKKLAYWKDRRGKMLCMHHVYKNLNDGKFKSRSDILSFLNEKIEEIEKNKFGDFGNEDFLKSLASFVSNQKEMFPENDDIKNIGNNMFAIINVLSENDKKFDPMILHRENIETEFDKGENAHMETDKDLLFHMALERKFMLLEFRAQREEQNNDTEQLSSKLVMNSHYGVISDNNSAIPQQTLGAGITAHGRNHSQCSANISENVDLIEMIKSAGALEEFKRNGVDLESVRVEGQNIRKKTMFGDTDSVGNVVPKELKNTKKIAKLYKDTGGKSGMEKINDLLPKMPTLVSSDESKRMEMVCRMDRTHGQMKMELEKINIMNSKARKKNYVAHSLESKKIDLKGVSAKKSDTLAFAARLEKRLYDHIFQDDNGKTTIQQKIESAISITRQEIIFILDGKYDPTEFIMTTTLSKPVESYMANGNKLPSHVEVALLKQNRNEKVTPGDKIRYVFIENGKSNYVDDKHLLPLFAMTSLDSKNKKDKNQEGNSSLSDSVFERYIKNLNEQALNDGKVAEDADYAFGKGLPLDVLYYIQIKFLQEMSKFFAPFFCNVLEWKTSKFGDGQEWIDLANKSQKKNQDADQQLVYDILTAGDIKDRMRMLVILKLQKQIIRLSKQENKFYVPKKMICRCVKCNCLFSRNFDSDDVEAEIKVNFLDEVRNKDGFYSVCPECKQKYIPCVDCEKQYDAKTLLVDEYETKIKVQEQKFKECEEKCWKCISNCGVALIAGKEEEKDREKKFYTKPSACSLSQCQVYRDKKYIDFCKNKLNQDMMVVVDHSW
jgi:DNA polymerase elongation subunit (family B)